MNPITPLRQNGEAALSYIKNRNQLSALSALGTLGQHCLETFGATSALAATLQVLDRVQEAIKKGDFDTAYLPLLAIVAKLRSVEKYLEDEEDAEAEPVPSDPWTTVRRASEAAHLACQDRNQRQTLHNLDKLEVWLMEVFKPAEGLYATLQFLEDLRAIVKAGESKYAEIGLLAFVRKLRNLEEQDTTH
jgi:hypothetical protein